jgi:hypothetical protein
MTSRELSSLSKVFKGDLPEFDIKGPMIFKITPGGILLGLYFGSSSRAAKLLRLDAFCLPLFVPTSVVHFNYGKRIVPEFGQWNADQPDLIERLAAAIRLNAVPFFNTVCTLEGVAKLIRSLTVPNANGYKNPHGQEALAYVLVKNGEITEALAILERIQTALNKSTISWELEIKARTMSFRDQLLQNPERALVQLKVWESETTGKLGLENIVAN